MNDSLVNEFQSCFLDYEFYMIWINFLFFLSVPGKGQEYWEEENICEEMPACQLMFNIFHPFDPVAYRSSWPLPFDAYIQFELYFHIGSTSRKHFLWEYSA